MDANRDRALLKKLYFDTPFSKADVRLVSGFSDKVLEHITKPHGPLRFIGSHQGRARKFTGHDILMIEVLRRLSPFGVSHFDSLAARDFISRRLRLEIEGDAPKEELNLFLFPYVTPDQPDRLQWSCTVPLEGQAQLGIPPEALVVNASRIINETAAKLTAVCDKTEIPKFNPLYESLRALRGDADEAAA